MVFYIYSDYTVNDETSSLDKLATRQWLANRDTLKVLTKTQVSKSILQFATNCVSSSIW